METNKNIKNKPKKLKIKLIGQIPSDCMIILEAKDGKREFITNKKHI